MRTITEWFIEGGRYMLAQHTGETRFRLIECQGLTARGKPTRLRGTNGPCRLKDIRGSYYSIPATDNAKCAELMADSFGSIADARAAMRPPAPRIPLEA